ncbi:hypothetical protein [Treponema pectinovorum]|uniref:hypothetical protein n=1 Tax=Treponema pectinovorum TaxID=164 RepID=UPI0011CB186B|nr:hypothetical protein [Treponema pectinovorum]
MIAFFLKKNFCDTWDNLLFIILSNLIPAGVIVLSYFSITSADAINHYLPNGVFIIAAGILSSVLFAWGANARKIADFNSPTWSLFFSSLKNTFFTGFIFGFLSAILILVVRIAFSFYLGMYLKDGKAFALLFAALIGWFSFIVLMAMQWFIPLYFLQEENNFVKCLKKSFIVYFDNASFSFFVLLNNIILLVLTIFTFSLIPGLNGITLCNMNACRLRLYKYDWFEAHPEYLEDKIKRPEVPWEELLKDDKESLGQRKLSSFLFPWK